MGRKLKIKRKRRSSKAEGVARPRCVEEAPTPLVCSYCARPAEDSRGGRWRFEVKRHFTRESRQDMLHTNDGELWWMRAQGPGEWWRRCWWWTDVHLDGEENGWSILLHQCGRCGARERTMADACSRIADKRAELGRANPEDDKNMLGCCSYCGGDITKRGVMNHIFLEEKSLDYRRGMWWMKHGRNAWRRCYVRYQTVTERERGTIVELRQCLHCQEEEVILCGVWMCASDTEAEEADDSSLAQLRSVHMD